METITIPEGYQLVKVSDSEYKIVPKEKVLPKTWEEFCKIYKITGKECFVNNNGEISFVSEYRNVNDSLFAANDKNILPSEEKAEAILALCQLIMLRDYYNDGWSQEQCFKDTWVYALSRFNQKDWDWYQMLASDGRVLVFKTKELAIQFLDNFKDLLEKLKPLYE